ncbi:SPR3 Sporulation-regulated protein 3 [Candida maltosa Xu316]|uniref:Septin-type G domain-containing protein n=1 Tax=Candida maltosa (strain Xu316) TaxID=1245528 RepID=M3HTJ0_CANMX|nr:hypothetical protein G210_5686 [Candida maltosa Xu316]
MTSKVKELKSPLSTVNGGTSTPTSSSSSPAIDRFLNPINLLSRKNSIKSISNVSINSFTEYKPPIDVDKKPQQPIPQIREVNYSAKAGLLELPIQCEKKSAITGGNFTIMLVGGPQTGKTSFINALFGTKLVQDKTFPQENDRLSISKFQLIENNIKLNLRVIESVNFANSYNSQTSWISLCKYIDDQFKFYFKQCQQPERLNLIDSRVHCCIYFLKPTCQLLSNLDIQTMKSLCSKTNLIPVIAKSDMLTKKELTSFQKLVQVALIEYKINVCSHIPNQNLLTEIQEKVPFVIVSSLEKHVNQNAKLVRGRLYPWGLVEVENEFHCDFSYLKNLLIVENMLEFISSTEVFYENFRSAYMKTTIFKNSDFENGELQPDLPLDYFAAIEEPQIESAFNDTTSNSLESLEKETNNRILKFHQDQNTRLKTWKRYLVEEQERLQNEISNLADMRNELQDIIDQYEQEIKNEKENSVHSNGKGSIESVCPVPTETCDEKEVSSPTEELF